MKDFQLLAVLADEVNNMDKTSLDDTARAILDKKHHQYVQNINSSEESPYSSEELARLNLLIEANTPLSEDFMRSVENDIVSTYFEHSNVVSHGALVKNVIPVLTNKNKAQETETKKTEIKNQFKEKGIIQSIQRIFNKLQHAFKLPLLATAMTLAVILSFNFDFSSHYELALPNYTMKISGMNLLYRNSESQISGSKSMTDKSYPGQKSIEFFPENQPTIFLRPEHGVPEKLETTIFLAQSGNILRLDAEIQSSELGAHKIHPVFDNTASVTSTKKAILIAIVAKQGKTPGIKMFKSLISSGELSFHNEDWVYLATPIILHSTTQ